MSSKPKPNFMKFFVASEPGTSALLATLLDPELVHSCRDAFLTCFTARLAAAEVVVEASGPQTVQCEYYGYDLIAKWGEWTILIENKVAGASIRPGQLASYYKDVCQRKDSGELATDNLAGKNICMVFLTPAQNTGQSEFGSLKVDEARGDKKVLLSWGDILDDIGKAFRDDSPVDPYVSLIRPGMVLTKELVSRPRGPKYVNTPERDKPHAKRHRTAAKRHRAKPLRA